MKARALLLAATLAVAACGSAPRPSPPRADGSLAIGITEPNPAFLTGSEQPDFERWHRALVALRPAYYRLVVNWSLLTRPDGGLDLARPQAGCMRALRPCAGWDGLRVQLAAVAAAQRDDPGRYRLMVAIYDTPPALAAPPDRCSAGSDPRSRPPRRLDDYRALVRAVAAEADAAGVRVEGWAAWNEPNHRFFLATCDQAAAYLRLVGALRETVPLDQLVVPELGGRDDDFVARLPEELICGARAFGQHDYAGGADAVAAAERALERCAAPPPIWVTETGDKAGGCQREQLERWYRDDRVTVAFHYTLREDDQYPTGLVSTDLTRALPALAEWQAWGSRTSAASPPPPSAC
jgi:hypothetical protein